MSASEDMSGGGASEDTCQEEARATGDANQEGAGGRKALTALGVSAQGQRDSPRGRGHGRANPTWQRRKGGDLLELQELRLFLQET